MATLDERCIGKRDTKRRRRVLSWLKDRYTEDGNFDEGTKNAIQKWHPYFGY